MYIPNKDQAMMDWDSEDETEEREKLGGIEMGERMSYFNSGLFGHMHLEVEAYLTC
jgi:hypothetical protein